MGDFKVTEESALVLKKPKGAKDASFAEAERQRKKLNDEAKATGEPNRAMRENATGAESPSGKRDTGRKAGSTKGQ